MEHLYIVDENDEVVEIKPRHELTSDDRSRASVLWLMNTNGEILIARRSENKRSFPGLWSYAVTGAVSHPESYEEAILREMEEELGIRGFVPEIFEKIYHEFPEGKVFGQTFKLIIPHDYNIVHDSVEVAEVKWVTPGELLILLEENPDKFVRGFKEEVKYFL